MSGSKARPRASDELIAWLENASYDPALLRDDRSLGKRVIVEEARMARAFLAGAISELLGGGGDEDHAGTCIELALEAIDNVEWALSERRGDDDAT